MTPPQAIPETERNEKIISMYKSGSYSISSLARMYKLSRQRIHQIVKKDREQEAEAIKFDETGH